MSNRRLMLRRRRRLPVTLGGLLEAVTAEVSATGFSAEMRDVFLPGARVHGSIACGPVEIPFQGVVTWAEPGHPRLSITSRFGVRFTELPEGLTDFLYRDDPAPRPPLLRRKSGRRPRSAAPR